MKNILVPIGTSPDSHKTLQYAVDFATEFASNVFVMDVFSVVTRGGGLKSIEKKIVKSNVDRLKEVIAKVDAKETSVKIATYKGDLADGLKEIDRELGIDMIVIAPKSNDSRDEFYLGNTTGSIVKQTDIPLLIAPKAVSFKPFKRTLVAFKSGVVKRKRVLAPLEAIKDRFFPVINMLLVKTPGYSDEDLQVNTALMDVSSHLTLTENATTYQGVLEHFRSNEPDLLCVFRRKRGFFKKLWEKNAIPKSEFFMPIPVLVLPVKED